MFYKVRIHAAHEGVTRDSVREHFSHYDGAVLIVYETEANRPHYQGIVWFARTEMTLRNHVRSAFRVSTSDYSIGKVKDYEAYTRYLCKGPTKEQGVLPDVVLMQSIDIDVKKKHEQFWDENKRLKGAGTKTVIDKVLQRIEGLDVKGREGRREVAREIVEVLKERKIAISKHHVRGLFNAVMLRVDSAFQESFIDEVISQF